MHSLLFTSRSLRESDLHVDLILNGRIGNVQPGQEGEHERNTVTNWISAFYYVKYHTIVFLSDLQGHQ